VLELKPGGTVVEPLWEPSVQVRVALTDPGSLGGVLVTGTWLGAFNGTVSGLTNPAGRITLTAPAISDNALTFTVVSLAHPSYEYRPQLNVMTQRVVTRADAD